MMRHLLVGLSVLAIFSSTTHAVRNQRKPKPKKVTITTRDNLTRVRRELEAVFAKRMQAVRNGDAETQIAQVSRDFRATEPDGRTFDYEQIANYIRQGAKQIVSVLQLSVTIEALTVKGNEAIVDARQKWSRTQRLGDGNIHNVETGVLQREIWVKTREGWKIRSVDNLREQIRIVDGNPVNRP